MSSPANLPLPDGYQLLDYRIDRLLSRGGFSFVYLACDAADRVVAIKEYMPNSMTLRKAGAAVVMERPEDASAFRQGLKCFFEEGKALAKITHPNVVRVENFFRANETVYMVMPYMRGRTLQFHIQNHQQRFNDAFLRRIFAHLLNGLREVHTHKIVHLDIKPANIYINMDGVPVLLDFGAARQVLAEQQKNLRPMYTAGFAAPEQYSMRGELGPWTDIYSIGATMFSCITSTPPPPANERVKDDKYKPLAEQRVNRFSKDFLQIIDWCLQLDVQARPPSVFALQKALQNTPEPKLVDSLWRKLQNRVIQFGSDE